MDINFFRGKRILVTGHTGFKGMWLCKILELAGAEVNGYALEPVSEDSQRALVLSGVLDEMDSVIGDIRDLAKLQQTFATCQPEFVLHFAAQPIVRESYLHPIETYETNVMGTVNLLECVRQGKSVRSVLNVTTDKVYENREWVWGYRENEPLDGFDPYSNSKSCSELVTHSYRNSFFADRDIAISTARAGNVIGGGDFSVDRIIPDCIRAAYAGKPIKVRNPNSVRPYQHVLEPLFAYLMILQAQYEDKTKAGYYNVGPDTCDCVTTAQLAEMFCTSWGAGQQWQAVKAAGPHEANFLKLDCAKIKQVLGWQPRWHIEQAIDKTVQWAKEYQCCDNVQACMEKQIHEFMNSCS